MEKPKSDIQNSPEPIRLYFKAKENKALPQYYLDRFKHKRDDYFDDLPKTDVRTLATIDEKGRFIREAYKCRGSYITGLAVTLLNAINNGIIADSKLIEKIQRFKQHDFRYLNNKFTTQQEINMINKILADVIQYLEK